MKTMGISSMEYEKIEILKYMHQSKISGISHSSQSLNIQHFLGKKKKISSIMIRHLLKKKLSSGSLLY